MSSAFGSLSYWPVHPGDGFCNPARMGRPLARGPECERLVAVAKHAAVTRLVFVHLGVGVHETEAPAQQLNILGLTSQKQPARTWPIKWAGYLAGSGAFWFITRRSWLSMVCCHGCSLRRRSSTCARRFISSSRSEEHTSELQSLAYLVCRLLLEKKKKKLT